MSSTEIPKNREFALNNVSLVVGAVGFILVIGAVVGSRTMSMGLPGIIAGACALLWAFAQERSQGWHLLVLQVSALVMLSLSLFGLCQSQCGAFAAYAQVGPVSVTLIAFVVHAVIFTLGVLGNAKRISKWAYVGALGVAHGASVFFLTLMVATQFWCASCAATHAVMAVQMVVVWRLLRLPRERVVWLLWVLVVAGGVNLFFHHRIVPETKNNPQELLQWLASKQSGVPLGQVSVIVPPPDDQAIPIELAKLQASVDASLAAQPAQPVRGAPPRPGQAVIAGGDAVLAPPVYDSAVSTAPASFAREGMWGSANAKIRLVGNVDPLCNHCEEAILSLWALADEVEAKRVHIDLALVVPAIGDREHYGASVVASCIQASALQSGLRMMQTARALMSEPGRAVMADLETARVRERATLEVMVQGARNSLSGHDADPAAYQQAIEALARHNPDVMQARDALRTELQRLNSLLPEEVDKSALNQALQQHKADFVLQRAAIRDRMREYGIPQAPTYWASFSDDPAAQPFVILKGAKDPVALKYVIKKGLESLP